MPAQPMNAAVKQVSSPPKQLEVVLVDALHSVRAGLRLLISGQAGMKVVVDAGSADETLDVLKELRRRSRIVMVVGLNLAGPHDGFWLLDMIRRLYPWIPTVACGANSDPPSISRSLFCGADGYVDRIAAGEVVLEGLPPDWLGRVTEGIGRQRDATSLLTDREREVIAIAAEGLTARQIGSRLGVHERTVTTYLGRIYKKLGAGGRMEAVAAASRWGLVSARAME